jgi:hypothetical protein
MSILLTITSSQLKRAAALKDKIGKLEKNLASILGASTRPGPAHKKKSMSVAGRAKIAAAQKARWAKIAADRDLKKASQDNKKTRLKKNKSKMSAAVRAKIAAAAKVRWAKAKAAGKTKL